MSEYSTEKTKQAGNGSAAGMKTTQQRKAASMQRAVGNMAVSTASQSKNSATKTILPSKPSTLDQDKKSDAVDQFLAFTYAMGAKVADWQIAAKTMGSAYAVAADRHKKAIDDQDRKDAITEQLMFSILAAVAGGGLSWLFGAGKLAQTWEDVAQVVAGEGFSAVAPTLRTPIAGPISMNPLKYQNDLEIRILRAWSNTQQFFAKTISAMNKNPALWDTNAQQNKYDDWLSKAEQFKGGASLVLTEDEMTDEIERGFWAKWVPCLSRKELPMSKYAYREITVYKDPGSIIEKSFDRLGITRMSGVGDFGWWTSNNEVQTLITWGIGYKVKQFSP